MLFLAAVILIACADSPTAPTTHCGCTLSRTLSNSAVLSAKYDDCRKLNLDSLILDGWHVAWN